ncbi:class I SAM-dependent methyltransferase [Halomonas icarae]|uniref:Methyltransferase domain-containing protein n=1 Tax=Halomonas icarae TaxID=2691040 RepID=A0A7X5ANF7_9GAMM|nr:class I SAM-dependent methyltransferase [Halomonas icarae]MDR5900940.1 class I SAM-dependent methyltransferase [Halomonas icarae]NAW13593.1 methyltransferase domain-containing protein [Halomonas icarae]
MDNEYGSLASWVYHVDKPIGRTFGDVEFYLSCLKDTSGPVLEPAVGNGRFLIPLLEAGHIVHGFDASPHMLDICKKEISSRNLIDNVSEQSFEGFVYSEKFSAVVIPAGSIQLIKSPVACLEFLKQLKNCLSEGGKIIVDIDSLVCMVDSGPEARMWNIGADMLTLTETRVKTSYLHQTTVSQLKYEHWNSGSLVSSELEVFSLRFWGVFEFRSLLHEAGFKDVSITIDYERPFSVIDSDAALGEVITFEASS